MTTRPTLSPEMLLFEVAAMCSRHGVAVSSANPSAALYHAGHLLQALGIGEPPQAITAAPEPATALIPRIPRGAEGAVLSFPLPPRSNPTAFTRAQHRPGAPRTLNTVET
jgi:hypothetical protein